MTLPKPYYQDSAVTLYHGDCRQIVPLLGRFDLLLTDPPYGMRLDTDYSKTATAGKLPGTKWDRVVGDDKDFDPAFLLTLSIPSVIWGANHFASRLKDRGSWLVWNKRGDGEPSGMHFGDCEMAWTNLSFSGARIFSQMWHGAPRWRKEPCVHPTQKSVDLMVWCLGFAPDAQTVLDPFAGSGTTGRACKDLGRKCVMIEREEKYCEIAARRMGQEVLPLDAA